ncbi:extracellular solute-binding protein [Vallitalea pronyensis]|uniref:Extracellular solute-binding protein n=1 Tax=Vallitalea pronyensis TaxID=1348613 RepID=A0A8J8SI73_9FIRM|nr:extracellular solute-binding protein [Vallitalea pronyensis]QUI24162.1 extracellular solute-binding protein [Vallitalea pronyensis]
MNKKSIKSLVILLCVLCVTSCTNHQDNTHVNVNHETNIQGLDMSEEVELTFYLLGPEPSDILSVAEELNKRTRRDLNCTVKWVFLGWDKWDQKYNLALSSGENIDLIYTAKWADYQGYARRGAFMPLDEMIPKYAPISWDEMTQEQWRAAQINGKIYTVPCDWVEYDTNGIAYRADLREAFGIHKPIETVEEMEAYFDAAKKANPDMIPFNVTSLELANRVQMAAGELGFILDGAAKHFIATETYHSKKIISFLETPEFETYCQTMKRWYDKGYWSENILLNQVSGGTFFSNGETLAMDANLNKVAAYYKSFASSHPDWEIEFLPDAIIRGVVHPAPSIRNGVALSRTCKHPERALAFIDKLRYDPDYYQLTNYGIKDKHYTMDKEGFLSMVETTGDDWFGYQSMQPWGWHIDKMELPTKNEWSGFKPHTEALSNIAVPDKYDAFAFNSNPVSAEISGLSQVYMKYVLPLMVGQVDDVNEALAVAIEKANEAGLQKLIQEVQMQVNTYWQEMAYE